MTEGRVRVCADFHRDSHLRSSVCALPVGHDGDHCNCAQPTVWWPQDEPARTDQFLTFPRIIPEADRVPVSDDEY